MRQRDMKPSSKLTLFIAAFVALAVLATACTTSQGADSSNQLNEPSGEGTPSGSEGGSSEGEGQEAAAQGVTVRIDEPGGQTGDTDVVITLDEADPTDNAPTDRETTVDGDPLDTEGVAQLLNRLPALEAEATDQVDFNRPPDTRPPPRPGATIDGAFPPAADADAPELTAGPLEVLRFQPEGPVDLAPFISVTFNQPMVALSTVDQVEAAEVPVTISPEMPGRWIWLGTRTVRFEYEPGAIDRIPASTKYMVTIPASTTSLSGGELGEEVQFEFSTPTPTVQHVAPMNDSMSTEPIFFIRFDQRVNPEAALGAVDLTAAGDEVTIRLATPEEINEDTEISSLTENALPERWIAIRPTEALPTDAEIQLVVGPNLPSAEGPETSAEAERFSGRTYGPFRIQDTRCGFGGDCSPGTTFSIEMTNPIDTETFSSDMITVEPEIPGLRIGVSWNQITVQGRTEGRTTYTVRLSPTLMDVFGQQLEVEERTTFDVGDAEPALFRPGRFLATLDPIVDDNVLNVTTINNDELIVTASAVDPRNDWTQFNNNSWEIARGEYQGDWDVTFERTVETNAERNAFTEVALDLTDALEQTGHAIVVVSPANRRQDDWRNEAFAIWVQNTKIGLDATVDDAVVVAWVTDLTTGEPIDSATVEVLGGATATTGQDGLARLEVPNQTSGLLAEVDGDFALIGDFWANNRPQVDQVRWYVLDDRGLYKPGETASIKGWIRKADFDVPSDLSLPDGGSVTWIANDAFGNEIGSGEVELSPLGGFDFEVDLPADITLGQAGVQLTTTAFAGAGRNSWWHELQVQEFRRPDFEVTAEVVDDGPYLVGNTFRVNADADYFAGGALGASPVDWTVTGSATSYSPPNWPDYTFGVWVPWWFSFGGGFDGGFGGDGFGGTSEFFSAVTSASGEHGLAITVDTEGKPRPVTLSASATVVDVTRQPITGSTSALVHPAELYVGMRGDRTFIRAGEQLDLDLIVTDLDGQVAVGETITVNSVRLEWRFESGEWTEVEVPEESCELESTEGPATCTFRPEEGGRYQISAVVEDANGRQNLTELTRWVAGGDRPTSRQVNLEQLTLVPSGQEFQPGDTAEILVQAPFTDAHGLLVITRGGIDRSETFTFDDSGSAVVQIPITEDDIPGIGIQFEVAGTAPRSTNGSVDPDLVPRPAFAAGQLTLVVPADERQLTVDVAPRQDQLEPGASTQVDVAVTNAAGEPVPNAEMLVVVVDEAVLSLTGYELQNPLDALYVRTGGNLQTFRGRTSLLLSDPAIDTQGEGGGDGEFLEEEAMADDESADFAADSGAELRSVEAFGAPAPTVATAAQNQGANDNGAAAIELRTNFDALAVFEPEVTSDADGRATIDIPLPDNLTRYRVMVVATANATDAGNGESNITARLPITVRPTPPRFANFGDVFEFPVIVQNATDEDVDVDVALRATNLALGDRAGATIRVPANDRVEVRFDVSAVEAGVARYQVAASTGSFADAAEGEFPVYTPATAEAFATYGVVDGGAVAQPFAEPEGVFPQFGGLEITTSSTAVAALTDAVIYMNEYRYENSDAFASRIIAIVSLDDILTAFNAEQLPSPDALRSTITSDLDRLAAMQNGDGGFPYWRRGRESIPYNTVQATHAMVLAEQEGFAVDEQVLLNAQFYLANIEDFYPAWYSERTRRAISAYALHVRNLAGDRDIGKASSLFDDMIESDDDPQLDVAAWLWPVLANSPLDSEIEQLLNNRVTETPSSATFATRYAEEAWVLLHSDRRTDAIVLDALVSQRPESDLVLKTLNGLLAARGRQGRWNNVQENSFVLLAGASYFAAFEDVDPDFIARAWLGDTYALEHVYEGRATERNLTIVPMDELLDVGDTNIVLERDGDAGLLYYRLGLRYAPDDFDLEPRDQGFVVQRSYEAVDDPADVVRNDDGTWTIRAGARVRVNLTMVADSRRTHVALIDPIPAGFEIVNPALATSEPVPQQDPSDNAFRGFWWSRWFDHQNLRDDRAEAFSTWLGAGSYEYTYVARAITPGTFVTPPTRAEQMYEPEVFGRSASTSVTIIDE